MGNLTLTFLGTGTSQGVPVIGCHCEVCSSKEIHDKRLRTSCLIKSDKGTQITIDCGPDFREQMLREDIDYLDAILLTHSHRDHVSGLDDVRSYNYLQQEPMKVYGNSIALSEIKTVFAYAFSETTYPGLPTFDLRIINTDNGFFIKELDVIPFEVMHYKLPILGYRIGNMAYLTDAKTISDTEVEKLKGVEVLIINALRKEEHFSHFNLKEALEFINKIKPKAAYLTHISHYFGLHEQIQKELPENVFMAYDGLTIEAKY